MAESPSRRTMRLALAGVAAAAIAITPADLPA